MDEQLTIRMPRELITRLAEVAAAEDRSLGFITRRILGEVLGAGRDDRDAAGKREARA